MNKTDDRLLNSEEDNISKNTQTELSEDEQILAVATKILNQYLPAFKELAK